jgi:hypothetical protein
MYGDDIRRCLSVTFSSNFINGATIPGVRLGPVVRWKQNEQFNIVKLGDAESTHVGAIERDTRCPIPIESPETTEPRHIVRHPSLHL